MSVLRAILARFARLLVRLARTLDPGLATAPQWVIPERMAALRQRYPGAPEHWLELVARRAPIAPGEAPPADRRDPPIETPDAHTGPPRPSLFTNFRHRRDRPAVHFAQADQRPRPAPSAVRSRRRTQSPGIPSHPAGTSERPGLTFVADQVRNPIANLLRRERPQRRPAMLRFDADPSPPRDIDRPAIDDVARSEHPAVFPELGARSYRSDHLTGLSRVPSERADSRWPEFRHAPLLDATFPDRPGRAARRDPSFAANDPRWPDLPALATEFGPSPALTRDEAALLAEQIGGTWSE